MNKQPKIWLSSPHMGDTESDFVQEAFATNWIAPLGPHVNGFEADLQAYNEVEHAAALSSGTAALHIGLDLLGVGQGDTVLCQSFTFCGSANPITYLGATPVFIDSEADTWNMDPNALEDAIKDLSARGKKPKAIIPVHLYGMPAKIDEIVSIAQRYEIPILEDAAESLGSTYKGEKTGTFGDLGVFSFNGNKIITTSGGGALVSRNKEWIDRARFLATQARDEAPHYQHSVIGYNYRLSNVLAGIGRGQMQVLDTRIAQRRANFHRYHTYFQKWQSAGIPITFQPEAPHSFSNRWLTCFTLDPTQSNGLTREDIRLALLEHNIESRPLWKPMHLQPVFQDAPYYGGTVCEDLFREGLCLPSGSNLTEEEWLRIETALDEILGSWEKGD
jgi:dTDP-4-amino-4,6-dideoxygalactose transaminase